MIIIILTCIGRSDPTGPAHKGADTAGQSERFLFDMLRSLFEKTARITDVKTILMFYCGNKNYLRYVSITLIFPAINCYKIDKKVSVLDLLANFTLRNQFLGQNDSGCCGNQGGCYGYHWKWSRLLWDSWKSLTGPKLFVKHYNFTENITSLFSNNSTVVLC